MDQSDKFWEEQEKELREVLRKELLNQRPLTSCGTPAHKTAMEKKKQAKQKDYLSEKDET